MGGKEGQNAQSHSTKIWGMVFALNWQESGAGGSGWPEIIWGLEAANTG